MFLKRCLILFCMLSLLTLAAVAESPLSFPCDSELSPFLSRSEHDVTFKIDLENNYRIETDYWGDEPMLVESGSFLILDDEFMLVNLRFSKEYDYSQDYGGNLPDIILLANFDLNIVDDTNPPEWRVWMYPDEDDPYAFHYAGTWNQQQGYGLYFYGSKTNAQGETTECFYLTPFSIIAYEVCFVNAETVKNNW